MTTPETMESLHRQSAAHGITMQNVLLVAAGFALGLFLLAWSVVLPVIGLIHLFEAVS